MADPARIKLENKPEDTASATEEHLKTQESENLPVAAKSTEENKEPSSEDQPKQDVKAVSSFIVVFDISGTLWNFPA